MTTEPPTERDDGRRPQPLVPRPVVGLIAVLLTLALIGYVFTSLLMNEEIDWRVTFLFTGCVLFTLGADPKSWPWGGGR